MKNPLSLVLSALAVAAILACTTSQVATPSAPNPTLTTPQPTAQLVATVAPAVATQPATSESHPTLTTPQPTAQLVATAAPVVAAQPAAIETPEPTATPVPTSTPLPTPTETPLPTATQDPTATPFPTDTPEPTATNTPEPTATPTPPPVLGSRENPVPFGQVVEILEGDRPYWAIVVSRTDVDATGRVLATNPFNAPPKPGNQFFMAEIEAKYLGPDSAMFFTNFSLKTVGQSAVVYTTYENNCGVIPDQFPSFTELFTGGAVRGWECWQIPSTDADSLLLLLDETFGFGFGDTKVWFNLK